MTIFSRLAALVGMLAWGGAFAAEVGDPPPPAASRSLLFTEKDAALLRQAQADYERLSKGGGSPDAVVAAGGNLYLTAVMDLGRGNWVVWANGVKITPDRQDDLFTVVSVANDAVDFAIKSNPPARVRLHPFQTWRARYRDVVDGILP